MEEHIGHKLPDHKLMRYQCRNQSEINSELIELKPAGDDLEEEYTHIDDNQRFDCRCGGASEHVVSHKTYAIGIEQQIQQGWNGYEMKPEISIQPVSLVECGFSI